MSNSLHNYILTALALLYSSHALAEKAIRPEIKTGDSWFFSQIEKTNTEKKSTFQFTVVDSDSNTIRIKRDNDGGQSSQNLEFTSDLNFVTDGSGRDTPSSIRFSWPLTTGKIIPVAYEYSHGRFVGRIAGECAVRANEKITVPAGEMESYRVDCDLTQVATSPSPWQGKYSEALWYAPEARFWIKMNRVIQGPGYYSSVSRELLSFSLK